MPLLLCCIFIVHLQRLNILLFFISQADQERFYCDYCALLAFFLFQLSFITILNGVSIALSARSKQLRQWLLYNSKQYCVLKLYFDDHVNCYDGVQDQIQDVIQTMFLMLPVLLCFLFQGRNRLL